MDGNTVTCCGIEQCSNISEEKVYEDPAPEECCTTQAAYSQEYQSETSCSAPKGCSVSQTGPYYITTGSGPKFKCHISCPEQKVCRPGKKIGYQQFAWEVTSSPWTSSNCPPDATYKKQECQTVCGGTTGCRTICKNICEAIKCSEDNASVKKDDSNVCTGTVSCGTSGCHCSNNPNWHP